MVPRLHNFDIGSQPLPKCTQCLDRRFGGVGWGRKDTPPALKKGCKASIGTAFFGTGDRVGGNDCRAGKHG